MCNLCDGTLLATRSTSTLAPALEPWSPCPRCLSTPATRELKTLLWMRSSPLMSIDWSATDDMVPACHPVGFGLLSCALAERYGVDGGASGPTWYRDGCAWILRGCRSQWAFSAEELTGGRWTEVPALAGLPVTDLDLVDLVDRRALVLAWETTCGLDARHSEIEGGKNAV